MSEHMPGTRLRFGLFEFEPDTNELRRDGALLRLQAQPSQVLACLLANAGEVVSREELRRVVWPAGTFVDFERGLNFCIAQIRASLKDDAASPRFIRTIPKRGYQFIAPVQFIPVQRVVTPQAPERIREIRTNAWRGRAVLLSVLALSLFAAGFWARDLALSVRSPIVAIARFDNETADPQFAHMADALTDDLTNDLVTELTSAGRGQFRVIGNAHLLRAGRETRDLKTIGSSLHASYVILGQIQRSGDRTRILAHLIHLPEQTHVSVARFDRNVTDPFTVESKIAAAVSRQFAVPIRSRTSKAVSPAL